jgi:hypothetical protein
MTTLKDSMLDTLNKAIDRATESGVDTCCFKLFGRQSRAQKLAAFRGKIDACQTGSDIIQAVITRTGSTYFYRQGGSTKMTIQDIMLFVHGHNNKSIHGMINSKLEAQLFSRYQARVNQIPNIRNCRNLFRALMPFKLFRIIEMKKALYNQIVQLNLAPAMEFVANPAACRG